MKWHIHVQYTLKYTIEREGKWRVGEQQAAVKAMTGVLQP